MPVTVKFSERFYERFGHELTDELVNHLNHIDQTYRTELRELNELNFARFDAKIEQSTTELRAELRGEMVVGFAHAQSERERGFAELRGEMIAGFAHAQSERERGLAELRGEMVAGFASCKAELIRWMFVFWAGTTVTVVGTMIALVKL